jgi:hypothetical protein
MLPIVQTNSGFYKMLIIIGPRAVFNENSCNLEDILAQGLKLRIIALFMAQGLDI